MVVDDAVEDFVFNARFGGDKTRWDYNRALAVGGYALTMFWMLSDKSLRMRLRRSKKNFENLESGILLFRL